MAMAEKATERAAEKTETSNVPEYLYALRVKGTDDTFLKMLPNSKGIHESPGELGAIGVANEKDIDSLLRRLRLHEVNRYEVVKIRSMKNTSEISIK